MLIANTLLLDITPETCSFPSSSFYNFSFYLLLCSCCFITTFFSPGRWVDLRDSLWIALCTVTTIPGGKTHPNCKPRPDATQAWAKTIQRAQIAVTKRHPVSPSSLLSPEGFTTSQHLSRTKNVTWCIPLYPAMDIPLPHMNAQHFGH